MTNSLRNPPEFWHKWEHPYLGHRSNNTEKTQSKENQHIFKLAGGDHWNTFEYIDENCLPTAY